MERAGVTHRSFFQRQHLKPLLDAGIIRMTIPDNPSAANQRYVPTDAGAALRSGTRESERDRDDRDPGRPGPRLQRHGQVVVQHGTVGHRSTKAGAETPATLLIDTEHPHGCNPALRTADARPRPGYLFGLSLGTSAGRSPNHRGFASSPSEHPRLPELVRVVPAESDPSLRYSALEPV